MSDSLINIQIDLKVFEDMTNFRKEISELIIFLQCLEIATDDRIRDAFKKFEEMKEARGA